MSVSLCACWGQTILHIRTVQRSVEAAASLPAVRSPADCRIVGCILGRDRAAARSTADSHSHCVAACY
jgi:hypothetical protein